MRAASVSDDGAGGGSTKVVAPLFADAITGLAVTGGLASACAGTGVEVGVGIGGCTGIDAGVGTDAGAIVSVGARADA